jgi:hypothetical protein
MLVRQSHKEERLPPDSGAVCAVNHHRVVVADGSDLARGRNVPQLRLIGVCEVVLGLRVAPRRQDGDGALQQAVRVIVERDARGRLELAVGLVDPRAQLEGAMMSA